MKIAFSLISLFILFSCKDQVVKKDEFSSTALSIYCQENKKVLDYGAFTIQTPENWYKVSLWGYDSYVGAIVIDSTDTIRFDIGSYSNNLPNDNQIYDISFQVIDGHKAKIVSPKKSTQGIVGIYIDSLKPSGNYLNGVWRYDNEIDKFNLYGENLTPENEKLFLLAIRTLRFSKRTLKNGDTLDTTLEINKLPQNHPKPDISQNLSTNFYFCLLQTAKCQLFSNKSYINLNTP